MLDELKRFALVTSGMAELTKARAEQVVKDLVKAGDIRRDQASSLVHELLRRSQENRKEVAAFVKAEISKQVEGLGLATKRDLERIERRVTRLEGSTKKPAAKKTAPKKSTAKKTTAQKKATGSKSGSAGSNGSSG